MSTISPGATRSIAGELAASGISFVDAPVSGGVAGARAGSLSIMVGGSAEDFERALPVLSAMGTKVTHMGSAGAGQATKLCNQAAVAINLQAVCEALMLGQALGVELEPLRTALSGGAADSWMLRNLAPQMIAADASAGFRIALQAKDLRLAGEAAEQTRTPLPGLASVTTLYREALARGEASNGNQALFRVYERLCNRPLSGPAAAEAS
jgi:2-hydroxy-3-oxopropionate reductase